MTDPYTVLGISQSASDEDVKKAYRTLCKKYHPDVNPNNPSAEARFKEVQTAHDRITRQRQGKEDIYEQQSSPYARGAGGGQQGSGYDPFGFGGGFGGFGGGFGGFGGASQGSYGAPDADMDMRAARSYLNAGHWREALNVLSGIKNKTAKWYYYSALANAGLRMSATARQHVDTAVEMEPDNLDYRRLKQQLAGESPVYPQRTANAGMPFMGVGKFFLAYMAIQFLINAFRMFFRG